MSSPEPVIEISNLTYTVNGKIILDGVDMTIDGGEIFAVMGLSGTGKTTLLRLIIGLIRPDSGSIRVLGKEVSTMTERELNVIRGEMGLVFQYGALFDSLTVRNNVGFRLYQATNRTEAEIRQVVADKLALVGMSGTEDLYPSELSGGMQKRVGVARALVSEPQILLFDEPTSGLDPVIAATIDDLMLNLRATLGVTEVVVSHAVASVMKMAHRMALLYQGHVQLVGSPSDFNCSRDPVVRQFLEGNTDGPIQVI